MQADLSLSWAHMSTCTFCWALAHLNVKVKSQGHYGMTWFKEPLSEVSTFMADNLGGNEFEG